MAAKASAPTIAREAMRLIGKGDLVGAAAAVRSGPSAGQKLSAKERADLEKILRKLERMLESDVSAKTRRVMLTLQRALQKWLTPTRVPSPRGAAKIAARPRKKKKVVARTRKTKAGPRVKIGKPVQIRKRARKAAPQAPSAPPPYPSFGPLSIGGEAGPRRRILGLSNFAAGPGGGGGAAGAGGDGPAPRRRSQRRVSKPEVPAAASIRRTPHMNIPPKPLQPGDTFEVSVYVDQKAARAGEQTTDVVVAAGAQVEVQLIVSEHFVVNGSAVTTMTITDATRSDAERPFSVTVVAANELPTKVPPSLIALFFYKGRPSGKVSRAVTIAGVATTALVPGKERVEVKDGVPADLTVVVTGAVVNDGRQFFCTVRSPLLEKYKIGVTEPWNLPQAAEDIVLSLMERFTADAITPAMLLAELRGAGRQLYDAAPTVFREALWDLLDSGHEIKKIALVTQEPFIPWELMIPHRMKDGRRQQREALGTEFCIGRWPNTDGISPSQKIPLLDSFVVAPAYVPPLSFALAEAKLVVDSFAGEMVTPADFNGIQQALGGQGKTLVHFVCHGQDEETEAEVIKSGDDRRTRNRVQIIRLENGETLNSTQILGLPGVDSIFEQTHPFVFLNACEIGRTTPALVGVGGFAKSFIDLGASAVIAPLWSVKDSVAHEIAEEFYKRVKAEPNTPFAEILRGLRQKAYIPGHAEDTYAAYCFYGDPAAISTRAR